MKLVTVMLTLPQAERVIESLDAHFAGDTSEGDLCWSTRKHKSALAARDVISDALRRAGE